MTSNRRTLSILGQSLLALAIGSAAVNAEPPSQKVPLSYKKSLELRNNPAAMLSLQARPATVGPAVEAGIVVGPWQTTVNPFPGNGSPANPLLMTDGTVIVHFINASFQGTQTWFQLIPDINGSYVNGTWSIFASLPAGYGPLFHASEVLNDGRVIINGGEYNLGVENRTNRGAIYYPLFGGWLNVAPPAGWTLIGDAQSVVLDNGTYMLADCCESPPRAALFRGTPPFDSSAWTPTGTGKLTFGGVGDYDEEGWTVLPKGNVLTVDAYHLNESHCDTGSEIYNPGTGAWSSGGSTIVQLPDCNTPAQSDEVGPQALRPDPNSAFDNLIAFGGTTSGTAHTAIYNATSGTWSAGPNVPSVSGVPYTLADAPAAILPSGNVLFAASPSTWTAVMATHFPPPTHFWEIGPNSAGNVITQVTDNPDGANSNSFQWNFLMLPTGQVLAVMSEGTPNVWIYTPGGNPNPSWVPVIDSSPINVSRASTYTLTGTQFNGLSHGAEYGDNVQANTNFPIVKIVNDVTGHVFYQRTFGFNTRSVARGAATSTNFMVTGKTETGPGTLYVIANGISSAGVPVVVR